jgi:hypothetical protein
MSRRFLLLILFIVFLFTFTITPIAASSPPNIPNHPTFRIATVEKMADSPVQWVTAGGGILAYGAGQQASFAPVNDPFSPVSHLTFDKVISEGLMLGRIALLSQEGLGLRMIDLRVPSNPLDLGIYPLSGTTFHLAAWGNLLFVSGVDPGIQIFEISFSDMQDSSLNLFNRGTIPVDDSIMALAASESKVYASTGKEVKVFDVFDPFLTSEADSLPVILPARSMAVNGNTLFIAASTDGLHVIDLSIQGKAKSLAVHPVPSESLYLASIKFH